MHNQFVVGQRWISHTETNLGLGILVEASNRQVVVSYPAAGEQRTYAISQAPLSRVLYKVGDTVCDMNEQPFEITQVAENDGLVEYAYLDTNQKQCWLSEIELDCFVQFNHPKDRLLSGIIEPHKFFNLRQDTLQAMRAYQQSGVQGLLGARVQLLEHQLYIAHQLANRHAPRVLLADEVGLGKTIEAGLLIYQKLQRGLASRVLIVVPDSLLYQWYVEMRRRFNLQFSLFNPDILEERDTVSENPFQNAQQILVSTSVIEDDQYLDLIVECDWDILCVDEAHHLEWTPQQESEAYTAVKELSQLAQSVLLLTATPEQLGLEGHFARLHLLDPERYSELSEFVAEQQDYQAINQAAKHVLDAKQSQQPLPESVAEYFSQEEFSELQQASNSDDAAHQEHAYEQCLSALIDRFGTGRVLFRNTRAAIDDFPQRVLFSYPLENEHPVDEPIPLKSETLFGDQWIEHDARVPWLLSWLQDHVNEQALLICADAKTAIELENFLRTQYAIRSSVFHEGMSLVERDRAAAYFADEDQQAQILICSEIGSEGRNFQFVHHLILFDLPRNPDLLEQRIGRLDRIGQFYDVCIHVPYFQHSMQQVLFDFYHQGMNAFEQSCSIGQTLLAEFVTELDACMQSLDASALESLIERTQSQAEKIRTDLASGRNALLELNSCRSSIAQQIIDDVLEAENRKQLKDFIERSCDQMGIENEDEGQNAIILRPGDQMRCALLPTLTEYGMTGTFSRDQALARDDMQFLTWDHPFVQGMADQILSTDHGKTAFATLKLKALKAGTLLLEAQFIASCVAPKSLQVQRFMPSTMTRVVVNMDGQNFAHILAFEKLNPLLKTVPMRTARDFIKQVHQEIETLCAHAEKEANKVLQQMIDDATESMNQEYHEEVLRLTALAKTNSDVKQSEIEHWQNEQAVLGDYLQHMQLSFDSLRLIICM